MGYCEFDYINECDLFQATLNTKIREKVVVIKVL